MSLFLYNGKIMTMEPDKKLHDSLLTEGDTIKEIGSYHQLRHHTHSNTLKIDLKGKIVLPGFIDNHTHFFKYLKEESTVNLKDASSLEDIERLIKKHQSDIKDDEPLSWIECSNLEKHRIKDYSQLDVRFLDRVSPITPIVLQTKDHHTICCNTAALKEIGIDQNTPDPKGGRIGRFADASPDGFLYEKAWTLLEDAFKCKNDSSAARKSHLTKLPSVLKRLYSYGLTGIHIMENYENYLSFQDVFEEKLRVCWHIFDEDIDLVIADKQRSYTGSGFNRFGTVKTFLDGSLGSSTALLSAYPDDNHENNRLLIEKDDLSDLLKKCFSNKLGLSVHSIGDRSTTIFLDLIDELFSPKQTISPMIRLEHLQFINKEDLTRIKDHGIYCSLQPYHISFDITLIENRYPLMREIAYPLPHFFEMGCYTGFGSDAPIADINPFTGIYSALTRKANLDYQNESWTPEYKLTPEQALYGYTKGAARGSGNSSDLGSLTNGKKADLIVIDDFRKEPPEFWLNARSYMTVINGKVVHNELK